jgi:hypothetical protein
MFLISNICGNQVQITSEPIVRRRRPSLALVPGTELRIRNRVPSADKGAFHDRAYGEVCVRDALLLRMRARRPPPVLLRAGEAVAEEVQGRLGDG